MVNQSKNIIKAKNTVQFRVLAYTYNALGLIPST